MLLYVLKRPHTQLSLSLMIDPNSSLRLSRRALPTGATASVAVTAGEMAAAIARLRPSETDPIECGVDVELTEHRSNAFYYLGFYGRRQAFWNSIGHDDIHNNEHIIQRQ